MLLIVQKAEPSRQPLQPLELHERRRLCRQQICSPPPLHPGDAPEARISASLALASRLEVGTQTRLTSLTSDRESWDGSVRFERPTSGSNGLESLPRMSCIPCHSLSLPRSPAKAWVHLKDRRVFHCRRRGPKHGCFKCLDLLPSRPHHRDEDPATVHCLHCLRCASATLHPTSSAALICRSLLSPALAEAFCAARPAKAATLKQSGMQ